MSYIFIRTLLSEHTHTDSIECSTWTIKWKKWSAINYLGHQILLLLHPFNSLFSKTTWVSRYQKDKTITQFLQVGRSS